MKILKITALLTMLGLLSGCYTVAIAAAGAGAGYIYSQEKEKQGPPRRESKPVNRDNY